jgi:hypothetical protein
MMSRVFAIKYSLNTGLFAGQTECDEITLQAQAFPGEGVVGSVRNVIHSAVENGQVITSIDDSGVVEWLHRKIDIEAGALRATFITDVPGQAQTYERKEREARSWVEGADPADFPFLTMEAQVRGVPVAQVQSEVMAQVNALTPLAAVIEAHRIAAKNNVVAAVTIGERAEAANVDWQSILAP